MDPITAAFEFGTRILSLIETAMKRDIAMMEGMTPAQREVHIDRQQREMERLERFWTPFLEFFLRASPNGEELRARISTRLDPAPLMGRRATDRVEVPEAETAKEAEAAPQSPLQRVTSRVTSGLGLS